MTLPPLPPGFELEESPQATLPPLPPGFELEQEPLEIDVVGGTPVPADQYDPSEGMGLYEQYRAGLGRSAVRGLSGIQQLGTSIIGELAGDRTGLTDGDNAITRWAGESLARQQAEEAERRRLDAPLMERGAAQLGDFVGTASQLIGPGLALRGTTVGAAFLPKTLKGNLALGGAFGAAQPVAGEGERGRNVGVGVAGAGLGSLLSRGAQTFTPAARAAQAKASQLGLLLKGQPGEQVEQVSAAARMFATPEKGAAMPALVQALKGEREQARVGATALFDKARGTDARVPMAQVGELAQSARRKLAEDGFDIQAMPGISKRLSELDEFAKMRGEAKLQAVEGWRRRVSTMTPRDGSPEQAAAAALRREYDGWITRQFNDDMIRGDKASVEAWREARDAWSRYKQTFDANKVVRDLSRKPELTQEQMRGWLFNASSLGAKRESGAVVARLNQILGPDSPQMQGLRSEVILDISEPLLRQTPDVGKFVANYEKFLANNPTLKRELFPQGMGDFDDLVKFARGVQQRPGAIATPAHAQGIWDKLLGAVTRYTFGHGIAQGGVRVRAATGVVEKLRDVTVGRSARKNILREYLGADPTQPMFPGGAGIPGAAYSAQSGGR